MKTIVSHRGPGCYDLLNPKDKSEVIRMNFGQGRVVAFTFKEDDMPNLKNPCAMHPEDLIECLVECKSIGYLFSSTDNKIEEKPHEERITLAREWMEDNRYDDNKAHIEVIDSIIEKLRKQLDSEERVKKSLEEECQEIELVHEGSMK